MTPGSRDMPRTVDASEERQAETRRIERPRLESRPLPDGWREWRHGRARECEGKVDRFVRAYGLHGDRPTYVLHVDMDADGFEVFDADADEWVALDRAMVEARNMVAVLEWLQHERAVRAQELRR